MALEVHFQIAKELRRAMISLGAHQDTIVPVDWRGDRLYFEFEHLGAKSDLLSIVGSYGDTASDEDVLEMISRWNAWRETVAASGTATSGVPGDEPVADE